MKTPPIHFQLVHYWVIPKETKLEKYFRVDLAAHDLACRLDPHAHALHHNGEVYIPIYQHTSKQQVLADQGGAAVYALSFRSHHEYGNYVLIQKKSHRIV